MTRHRQCFTAVVLADYIGANAANAVAAAYGGITVKVPMGSSGAVFDDLRRTLGTEVAAEFIDVFRGEHIYIAMDDRAAQDARIADLMSMRSAGMTFAEIARRYRGPPRRYSERWIRQLIGQADDDLAARG